MLLYVDEKKQNQALDRPRPLLPMGLGNVEGVPMTKTARHRHQELLGFLRQIETSVPEVLNVNLLVNNYCTLKRAKVKAW